MDDPLPEMGRKLPHHPCPFSINILNPNDGSHDSGDVGDAQSRQDGFLDQFPASYRIGDDDRRAPTTPDADLIARELDVPRLHGIINLLWFAGRPAPPRPLHYQVALGREIVVRELMETHLIWGSGRLFLKPIPRYLLNPHFWADHLSCDASCPGHSSEEDVSTAAAAKLTAKPDDARADTAMACRYGHLRQCALGFLLSYVALIVHESDFVIAKDKHLIPDEVTWPRWRAFVRELLAEGGTNDLYATVAPRFVYGELRLNRLNILEFARHGPLTTGFMATWHSYGSFLRDNSEWIIAVTAFVVVVLSAMQVGLSTERLAGDETFQAASYGFTVLSILGPIVAFFLLVLLSAILWGYNVGRTKLYERRRAKVLGRTWRDKKARERLREVSAA